MFQESPCVGDTKMLDTSTLVLCLLSFGSGYLLCLFLQLYRRSTTPRQERQADKNKQHTEEEVVEDSDEDEDYKLVLCIRTDLKMTKGKAAAQCGHATLGAYKTAKKQQNRKSLKKWKRSGQKKITVCLPDEATLYVFYLLQL